METVADLHDKEDSCYNSDLCVMENHCETRQCRVQNVPLLTIPPKRPHRNRASKICKPAEICCPKVPAKLHQYLAQKCSQTPLK